MKDDIRKATCLIIRKNSEYFVGTILYSTDLRWSIYPYDAYQFRNRDKAEEYALKLGGIVMLFNPVARQMRVL
ncbi:MAG: hypothetical protein J6Y48_08255 [Clostridia bacterium]|nr:hypothetical protein [Clostridia bacterium]